MNVRDSRPPSPPAPRHNKELTGPKQQQCCAEKHRLRGISLLVCTYFLSSGEKKLSNYYIGKIVFKQPLSVIFLGYLCIFSLFQNISVHMKTLCNKGIFIPHFTTISLLLYLFSLNNFFSLSSLTVQQLNHCCYFSLNLLCLSI